MENKSECTPNYSYGMKHVDFNNLSAFEAVSVSIVGVLAVTLGVLLTQVGVLV